MHSADGPIVELGFSHYLCHALKFLCFAILKTLKVAFQFADYFLKRTNIEIDDM